jgi:plastocyanin
MSFTRYRWRYLLGMAALSVALAACGTVLEGGAAVPVAQPVGVENGGSARGEVAGATVHVMARDFALSLDQRRLPAGTVTFVLRNDGPLPHDFAVRGNGVDRKTAMIPQGQTQTLTVELRPGTYDYVCTVPGHAHLGMRGTLTVA